MFLGQSALSIAEEYGDPLPPYSPAAWNPPRVAEYAVLVQYMSEQMELHQVLWHTFGLFYNGTSSVEATLERSLIGGNEDGVFLSLVSEESQVLCGTGLSLCSCMERGIGVRFDAFAHRFVIKGLLQTI